MALDFIATSDGTKIPSLNRTDGAPASGTVEVPESVASFDNGSQVPVRVSATNPLPSLLASGTVVTGSLTSTGGSVVWTGGSGFVGVEIVLLPVGATQNFLTEVSPDGVTWYGASAVARTALNGSFVGAVVSSGNNAAGNPMVLFLPVPPTWQARVRLQSYSSGSESVWLIPVQNSGTQFIGGTVSINGTVTVQQGASISSAAPGWSVSRTPSGGSAASTNATSVKTSSARLSYLHATNTSASWRYVKLYNKNSAPTVGTDTPLATFALPPSWSGVLYASDIGAAYGSGLGYAITAGAADSDTTAVGAGDVFLTIYWA